MSKTATVGRKAPDICLDATGDQRICLKDLRGKHVVLYFYPKDLTPGCTIESVDFQSQLAKFKRAGAVVLGISRDKISLHDRFRDKHDLKFDLLSDPDEIACTAFEVIKEKNMYGKKVFGIERSTFLIDDSGELVREWRKVKVDGHVAEILAAVKTLRGGP
jgi:thioredoxin-dependent peroxiredoxin